MTFGEVVVRIFGQGTNWVPAILAVLGTTLIALVCLLPLTHDLWLDQKRFGVMGLFFDMKGVDCLRVACSWIKFVVTCTFIIQFTKLDLVDYTLIAVPGLIYVFVIANGKKAASAFLWLVLEVIGMISVNAICGFIHDVNAGVEYVILYLFLGMFLGLFALYLLINEIHDVSIERRANIGKS
ncbi:MAG: hypothetical protein R3Y62_06920 [Eubacteriales bacterium]